MTLPIELVILIAQQIKHDRKSLYYLSQLTFHVYEALTPTLFERIELVSSASLVSLCDAICTGSGQLGTYVQELRIGETPLLHNPVSWVLHKGCANPMRSALLRMPNLRNLSIFASAAGFNKCFNELKFPFTLQRLELICRPSRPFKKLMSTQISIRELRLFTMRESENEGTVNFVASHPQILPRLNCVTASQTILAAILPGRSIPRVIVDNYGEEYSNTEYWPAQIPEISSAVLSSSGIYYHGPHYTEPDLNDPWMKYIVSLRNRDLDQNITSLTLWEPPMMPIGMALREIVILRLQVLRSLGGFPKLERFDIELVDSDSKLAHRAASWLGNLRDLYVWKEYVPSLKGVSVYGMEVL